MTAKVAPLGTEVISSDLDAYDQQLMTAVVGRAEKAGKKVKPLIVPTNNPLHAILTTARDLGAHELVLGASNKYTADEHLEQIAFYWINLHGGNPAPLTIRILTRERDMTLDLSGGNRIPKISERKAKNIAELRAAGVGISRVLMVHDGTSQSSDLFQGVLTMLDPAVPLALAPVAPPHAEAGNGLGVIHQDHERARQLGRELIVLELKTPTGAAVVAEAKEGQYDLVIWPCCRPRDDQGGCGSRRADALHPCARPLPRLPGGDTGHSDGGGGSDAALTEGGESKALQSAESEHLSFLSSFPNSVWERTSAKLCFASPPPAPVAPETGNRVSGCSCPNGVWARE